jgi:hypothetical protein
MMELVFMKLFVNKKLGQLNNGRVFELKQQAFLFPAEEEGVVH